MSCSLCHQPGHNAGTCPTRPDRVESFDVPEDLAEPILDRIRPVIRSVLHSAAWRPQNFIETLALSCYTQGLLDGRSERVSEALSLLDRKTES